MRIHEFYPYCQRTTQPRENEQLMCQFYHQSPTIPSKQAARNQTAGLVQIQVRKTDNVLGAVTPIFTWRVSMLEEHTIYNKSDYDDEKNTTERSRLGERWWRNIYKITVPLNALIHSQ